MAHEQRDSSPNSADRTCCGVIEKAAAAAQEKRENRTKPQPWIVRKLMVVITLGIIGYAGYVYISHLCLPMIRRRNGAGASRETGIALLVVFCVLYFWMIWAYLKVITTPPGYAKDYVSKSARPLIPVSNPIRESWNSNAFEGSGPVRDLENGQPDTHQRQASLSATTAQSHASPTSHRKGNGLAGPSYEDLMRRDGASQLAASEEHDSNAGVLDAFPKPVIHPPRSPTSSTTVAAQQQQTQSPTFKLKKSKPPAPEATPVSARQQKLLERDRVLDSLHVRRRPPTTAVLQPVHRYCSNDEIVKPYRAHHCRVCGTCVLKYDHHCPWIGGCVGARNHKFFLNFCQATSVFASYVFGTLLAYTVKEMNTPSGSFNPQQIILIAIAGLFLLFTSTLVASHVNLITNGQTTVESMQIHTMKERETATMANGFSWWEFGGKKRRRMQWDQEWGALNTEGNIWWRGSSHDEWVDVMGKNPLGWILPIGRSLSDGLSYPVNPRFDSEGRWRPRSEWPDELR